MKECWAQRYPAIDGGSPLVLQAEVFWTTRDISNHDPVYEADGKTLLPGFQKFHEVSYTITDHLKKKWNIVDGDNGEQCYEMYSCVVARVEGNRVQLGFKVITDDTQPFDEEGNARESVDSTTTVWDKEDFTKIWDPKFNHVAKDADPAAHAMTKTKKKKTARLGGRSEKSAGTAGKKKKPNEMFVDSDVESGVEDDEEIPAETSSKASGKAPVAKMRATAKVVMLDDGDDEDVVMDDDEEEE